MKEQKDNSSLPILLAIAGTVLLSVAVGWFLLERDNQTQFDPIESQTTALTKSTNVEAENDVPITDVDANLRKARLAAAADVLAYPPQQSALHFYGRIMAAEPGHGIARAELDAVLGRISQEVASHLAAQDFGNAHELALLVAKVRPDHPLVHEVQQTLDEIAGEMIARAMQHTRDGKDKDATALLVAAEALPGRQPDYFAAVRDSISEIKKSRKAAETRRVERSRRAAAQATKDWVEKVRGAIDLGRLVTPPGESARDYLAERDTPSEQKEQLTIDLVAAMVAATKVNIGLGELPTAEFLLTAADELAGDDAEQEALHVSLEQAYIDAEESKVLTLSDMVSLNRGAPRYPSRAHARAITGWVNVMFTVTTSGETANIEVAQSEPQNIFNASAIKAVEKWTFEPRVFRGQQINQRIGVRLVFNVE